MDRRKFVASLGLGSAAAALAACAPSECEDGAPAAAGERFRWQMVTTWPKNFPGLGTGAENFAKLAGLLSGGRLQIRVHGAGELVPAMEVFDAVSAGSAEMGHGAAYYWRGKHPAAPFFTSVPFGMNAQEMNSWLAHGGGQALWDELYAGFNLKPFACGNTGVQMAGWFNREINSISDLRGLKMRIPGIGGSVFRRVGGVPVQLAGGEVFTALQTGVIDAAEWVGPWNDMAFGFQRITKNYYYPGWQEPGPTLELIINREKWQQLPEDLQRVVTVASRAINQDMLDEYTARNNDALNELVEKHDVQLKRLPDDVLAALHQASIEEVEEIAASGEFAKRVRDSYRAFEKKAAAWHAISEQPYYEIRGKLGG